MCQLGWDTDSRAADSPLPQFLMHTLPPSQGGATLEHLPLQYHPTDTDRLGLYHQLPRHIQPCFKSIPAHCCKLLESQFFTWFSSVQFSCSVVSYSLQPHGLQHARPPLCHQLPEFTQTHVHWVSDAIQPSHPLLTPSPLAFNFFQHQGLVKWVSSSHQVANIGASVSTSVVPMNIQNWFPLGLTGWIPCSPKDSQESSPTPQFQNC